MIQVSVKEIKQTNSITDFVRKRVNCIYTAMHMLSGGAVAFESTSVDFKDSFLLYNDSILLQLLLLD